eukprot:scaffold13897_cov18-Prasinocladus_malaysianus.AAC.1
MIAVRMASVKGIPLRMAFVRRAASYSYSYSYIPGSAPLGRRLSLPRMNISSQVKCKALLDRTRRATEKRRRSV